MLLQLKLRRMMLVLEQDYKEVVQIEDAKLSEELYWSMQNIIEKIYLVRKVIEKFTKQINKKYEKNITNMEDEFYLNIFNYFGTFEESIVHQRSFWSTTEDEFGKRNIDRRIKENIEFNLFLLESFKYNLSMLEKINESEIYRQRKSIKKIIKKSVKELNKILDNEFDEKILKLFHQFTLNSSKNRVLSRVSYNRIFQIAKKFKLEELSDFRFMFYESFEINLTGFVVEQKEFKEKLELVIEEQNVRILEKINDFKRHNWEDYEFERNEQEKMLNIFKK